MPHPLWKGAMIYMNRFRKFIVATLVAVVAVTLAVAFGSGKNAASASTQFVVHVQASHRLLTGANLFVGEVLHIGLDGFPVTIVNEQFNGGGTVAWTNVAFPASDVGKTILMTVGGS